MIIGLLLVLVGLGGLALICLFVEPAEDSTELMDDWSYETPVTFCQKLHAHERACYEQK